ncbi:hypothetical protein CHX26_08755 [Porphyrobacter sp. HT-58-2]|uniref:hypothetical protein n=1 Tax=Porphyrobacter sp. HT-58-2 TaxID=2023229 RepID=UPI000CDC3BEE|nr:hypothetical protein [Porphyrobacter sp. HT-58-2]AUX69567.1 hypothetical protein CHX26_08755 [Porphyrobacter sp. HT-58-2]
MAANSGKIELMRAEQAAAGGLNRTVGWIARVCTAQPAAIEASEIAPMINEQASHSGCFEPWLDKDFF